MSDSDNQSSGATPAKPATNGRQMFLLAAVIGILAIIVLFFIFRSQDAGKQSPISKTPPPVVQPVSKPAVVVAKPARLTATPAAEASKPVLIQPKQEAARPEPQPVDKAIIPADHSGPPWALNLISLSTANNTPEVAREITALGFTPEVVEVIIGNRRWFRVRIKGFATIRAARKAGQAFLGNKQYRTLWIGGY